ncbi:hypothetical protein HY251_20710 [bacterium]|nr:hypothetical protein [bacterium]
MGRDRAAETLVRFSQPGAEPDLEAGAFEIARLEDPDVDCGTARARVDDLGLLARRKLGRVGRPPSRASLAALASFLGETEGFEGDRADEDVPRCSSLPHVLERKRGLPIALSVVYLLVAARAGVALYGVGAPLHFIVGALTDDGPLYLDPFDRGRVMGAEDVASLLRKLDVSFRPEHLSPTGTRAILARMARNLVAYHARKQRGEPRARRYARVALAMEEAP